MSIVFAETSDREIGAYIFSYENCENAEQVQEEIKNVGGEEKVIAILQFDNDDILADLFRSLCAFSDGLEGSFQFELEKLLTKVFETGKKYGMNFAKKDCPKDL